ncbi:MAG: hypothetical protein U0905_08180 [Pirellulales bacterium]
MVGNSIVVMLGAGVLASLLAMPLGLVLSKLQGRGSSILAGLLTGMMFVPLYIQAGGWNAGFGALGWWTVTQAQASQNLFSGLWAVTWIHAFHAIPWCAWILAVGLTHSSPSHEAQAMLDGGTSNVLLRVWLPNMIRWGCISTLIVACWISGDMVVTNLYRVPTLTEQCYLDLSSGADSSRAFYLSMFPPLLLTVALGISFSCTSFITDHVARPSSPTLALSRSLSISLWPIAILVACIAIFAPLGNLVMKAGWDPIKNGDQIVHQWTFHQFGKSFLSVAEFMQEFYWSIMLVGFSTILTVLCCVPTSYLAVRFPKVVLPAFAICLSLPGPMIAITVKRTFESLPPALSNILVEQTLCLPAIALQFRTLPIAVTILYFLYLRWRSQYRSILELDGYSAISRIKLFIGLHWGSLGGLLLLILAIAMSELSCYLLVLPAGVSPLSMRIFELLHYGVRYKEAGLCLVLAIAGILLGYLAHRLFSFSSLKTSSRTARSSTAQL